MHKALLFSFLAGAAALVVVACGDDPGPNGLGFFYPIDASADGVLQAYEEAGEPYPEGPLGIAPKQTEVEP
jgi:hypothetical protein